jgi:hypothetical protein
MMITRRLLLKTFVGLSFMIGCRQSDAKDTAQPQAPTASQPQVRAAVTALNRYFEDAEIQAETPAQREEILRALRDMTGQSAQSLREKRYADYSGTPNQWTLAELLKHHVFSPSDVTLTDDLLVNALTADDAKASIRRVLSEYEARVRKAR